MSVRGGAVERLAPYPQKDGPDDNREDSESQRPAKRTRVAVACVRCKTRKQKCDGAQPKCGNCKNLPIVCEYIVPSKTMPYGKYQYVKALEARVAELEVLLANAGLSDSGKDQWEKVLQSEAFHDSNTPLPGQQEPRPGVFSIANLITPNSSPKPQNTLETREAMTTRYLKDLSLQAGGSYVGDGSSNISVGHMFRSIVRGRDATLPSIELQSYSRLSPKSTTGESGAEISGPKVNLLSQISLEVAEKLLKGYLKHISTRWVAVYRPQIIQLHKRRAELEDPFDISTLSLVYATGGRFLETTGETGSFHSEGHYLAAMEHLDHILQAHNMQSVQTLLLHAVYCLRAPRGLSAWTHVGLALRISIELGMHRKVYAELPSLEVEMRKRVFWSCYCLDRQVSIILGRPFAISDRDIDAELPLDVDDSATDEDIKDITPNSDFQPRPSTSLSCFIHTARLRRIESQIQQSIYRVDKPVLLPPSMFDCFLESLATWKEQIPAGYSAGDTEVYSYDGHDYHMIYYYKCMRLLLYPHLTTSDVDSGILFKCAEACGAVCRIYKDLHRKTSVGFSLMALYSIFISGLTLLYCLWLSPSDTYNIQTSNDLNACSIVLYVIAERWPGAKKYRDAFESIRQSVLDLIAEGGGQKRVPLRGLQSGGDLKNMVRGVQGLHPEGRVEFSRMMSDMVGDTATQLTSPISPPTHMLMRSNTATSTVAVDGGIDAMQQYEMASTYGLGQLPGNPEALMYAQGTANNGNDLMQFPGTAGNGMGFGQGQVPLGSMNLMDHFDMGDFLGGGMPFDPLM